MNCIEKNILKTLSHDTFQSWKNSFTILKESFENNLINLCENIEGGSRENLSIEILNKQFQKLAMNLKPIETIDELIFTPNSEDEKMILDMLQELKDDLKKNSRVNYKLIQDLQFQIEDLMEGNNEQVEQKMSDEEIVKLLEEFERTSRLSKGYLKICLKGIDALDLLAQSAARAHISQQWVEDINKMIENYLTDLASIGIEQIEVEGKLLDGNEMISIGTVPYEQYPEMEKFEVFLVHERGFRYKETGKLIREAKVINVY